MRADERKAAVAAWKERKVAGGIYRIRCTATGEAWVGTCGDLASIENRLRFTLRFGSHANPGLQRAWDAHGPDAFTVEALERVAEKTAYLQAARLKARLALWLAQQGMQRI